MAYGSNTNAPENGNKSLNHKNMNIDFSRIEIFTDIAHTTCSICDLRTQFADVIYNMGNGIEAHALALKIYNSEGPTFYDDKELILIKKSSKLCSPAFIDAVDRILNITPKTNDNGNDSQLHSKHPE
jgi:hypothetical protein